MPIELTPEVRKQAQASLRRYLEQELEQDVSDVQCAMLLRFFLKEIAPSVFNAGLARAEAYLHERLTDLEGSCSELEFGYWPKTSSVRRK
jgi:uncharacterized protein (DUF2164 family)